FTLAAAPAVTTQPASVSAVLGNGASFSVAASGSGTLSYQWYKGSVGSGTALSGATAATYTISATATGDAGTYYCVVTNAYGSATSSGATLTLTEPLANFLSTYNLTSYTADADGDGISNLLEFVLGGDPTTPNTAVLPTATRTVSNGTAYLVYGYYSTANLGSVSLGVQYSTDLSTWTTAVNGTDGVTVSTTAYSSSLNYTTVTIPDSTGGGKLFVRLVANVPGTYSASY
ncbi:MAG: immunoglobulin domain-containing protein, partial [Gluconacetobacter diazotrophicus]|nr:immunoglobulin domain-containing protein [Gluconacetobacter diazotrophicus]